jgi:hypothetical protein
MMGDGLMVGDLGSQMFVLADPADERLRVVRHNENDQCWSLRADFVACAAGLMWYQMCVEEIADVVG